MSRRRTSWSAVLAAVVLVAAGFAVGVVELLKLPKGSVWGVVAVALVLLVAIRRLAR